jgi:hypothetical protein
MLGQVAVGVRVEPDDRSVWPSGGNGRQSGERSGTSVKNGDYWTLSERCADHRLKFKQIRQSGI